MNLELFKEEYCKQYVKIKGINFEIKKIPAFKAAGFFTSLVNKFSGIASVDLSGNNTKDGANILINAISSVDEDYLNDKIYPMVFKYISLTSSDDQSLKNLNFYENRDLIESKIDFDDIFELILRGLCVNFFLALSGRLSKFQTKEK
jgi:hypothetical protein